MADKTFWETTKVQGDRLLETFKKLVHEGNVRRIIIKQGDRSVAEFPLSAGVVVGVVAPILAAVGALAALIGDCTIAVERELPIDAESVPPSPATPGDPADEVAEVQRTPPDLPVG